MAKKSLKELEIRLNGIRSIMEDSDIKNYFEYEGLKVRKDTGFQPLDPGYLQRIVGDLVKLGYNRDTLSLDMGCGNGGFALFAAAAGFHSYGIDINPYLINEAKKNKELALEQGLINPEIDCEFAVGNMYPSEYIEKYGTFC